MTFAGDFFCIGLAAHHPEKFANHTHLIIDEIHERSVDTDLLCYMTKRLLTLHPQLRLVVMSATLNTTTYANYFNIPEDEYLFVGARRFPLKIHFLHDVLTMKSTFSSPVVSACKKLCNQNTNVLQPVQQNYSKVQLDIAFDISRKVGIPGRSVLIFVSGIAQITELVERFLEIKERRGRNNYLVIPIHSDIPFDEQMTAFEYVQKNEDGEGNDALPIKIVVATNAAESSITLPDCDHVICLGTAKRVEYNARKHRTQLVHRFCSKAGCDQRAGRTGRVRPGTVWRLYTHQMFSAMDEFDPPEIQQTPLEHVILQLKSALNTNVIPVLENVISPPDLSHIQPSFNELHRMRYIESPDDDASLTQDGTCAALLGLDLKISQVVIYGIKLGIPHEAVAVAAALSMDKSPFRQASPFVHTPIEMANITSSVVNGMSFFDQGMYSTPLMLVRVLHWYRHDNNTSSNRSRLIRKYGLAHARTKRLHITSRGIEMKMSKFVDCFHERELVDIGKHPRIQT
jgi:HrpA-like RNA helicase